jgi:rfaE bifunctional protein kinase chain/domain
MIPTPNDMLKSFQKLSEKTVLIAGDVMLDEFHWCHVSRISPEAPVPVCRVDKTTLVPGGAANVAHNVRALGGKPILLGVVGDDSSAKKLIHQLNHAAMESAYLLKDPERPTTLKSRIIAHHQQVVRVDREDPKPLSATLQAQLFYKVGILSDPIHGISLSDYLKGTLTPAVISHLIALGKKLNVPVVVDPKGESYLKYKGASILTPNFTEFQQAIGRSVHSEDEVLAGGLELISTLDLEGLVITRSEKGMSVISKTGERWDIPTYAKEVYDVTGAGDTVIAMLTLALASGLSLPEACTLSNKAAGVVVGKLGTAILNLNELKHAITHEDE